MLSHFSQFTIVCLCLIHDAALCFPRFQMALPVSRPHNPQHSTGQHQAVVSRLVLLLLLLLALQKNVGDFVFCEPVMVWPGFR